MPVFGITTSGGSTFPATNDRAILSKFTAPSSGTVTQINQLFDSTSTAGANFKGLIYAADGAGGIPGTRLGVGSAVAVPAGGGDLASTGLSVSIVGGVDYWIGSVASDFQAVWQCDSGGAGLSRMEGTTYASPASTWTQSGTGVATVNVYATYVSGPAITAQPADRSAFDGGSVAFTSSAVASAGSLTWELQDNSSGSFANISTGSGSPASIPIGPVTLAMNGRRYRIIWTDTNGSTTSSEVTLFVRPQVADTRRNKIRTRGAAARWTWAGYANEKATQRGWFSRDIVLPINAGGGASAPVGTSTETDTAFNLGSARPAGLSSETDTALALAAVSVRATGLAAEADSSLALAPLQIRAAGTSTEADTALALSAVQRLAAGLATEADTALALSAVVGTAAGLSTETDTALARAAVQILAVGLAAETDTALALSASAGNQVGAAAETDTALALAGVQVRAAGLAAETDAALALAAVQARAAGLATEADTALAMAAVQLRATGVAVETDSALGLSAGGAVPVGLAVETDTAFALDAVSVPQIVIPQTSFSEFSGAVVKTKQEPRQPRVKAPKAARHAKREEAKRLEPVLAPVGMAVEAAEALALQSWVIQRGLVRSAPKPAYPKLMRDSCPHCGAPAAHVHQ